MTDFKLPSAYFPIEEGELLTKYFSRTSANAHHDVVTRTWYAPSGLDRYIEPFKDVIGTFEDLRGHHTFLPLQLRTTTPEQTDVIIKHTQHEYAPGIMAPLGMNGPNGGRFRVLPTLCPECAKSNIALCGTPYWNRANMVPGLLFCSEHRRPLEVGCEECAVTQNHNKLVWPGKHCGCGLKPLDEVSGMSSSQEEHEIELHRVTKLLLCPDYMPGLNRDSIGEVVRRRTRELGLIEFDVRQTKLAHAYLSNHSTKRLLERCGVLSTEGLSNDHLTGKLVYLNPLQSSALLMALFDGWTNVENAIEEMNADDIQFRPLKRKPGGQRLELELLTYTSRKTRSFVERNRESLAARAQLKYIAIRENMPHLNHRGIRKELACPGQYAPTVKSLRAAGESVPEITFDSDRNKVIDKLLSERVVSLALKFARSGCGRQVSTKRLLAGTILSKKTQYRHLFPLTDEALTNHSESHDDWCTRVGRPVSTKGTEKVRALERTDTAKRRPRENRRQPNQSPVAPLVDFLLCSDAQQDVPKAAQAFE
ncbi:hypothetical protein [Paraburkholderia fungorum]|uniref:TniQ protein n=1 Tax=Paraburkholderia fungorum TaxID=134537 RepID=A0A420FUU0_9BURK|nr:hypothetical protein [Paraburkholderia fungorum]RKF36688.1 hypothetical protein BCY88_35210 [Paraburkholderia fungorum]